MAWSIEVRDPAERARILQRVARLEPWYHSFELADWLVTSGAHKSEEIQRGLDALGFPTDLAGARVLDVGSNAGFYSFLAEQRGARSVLGVELDPRYVEQARFVGSLLGSNAEFRVGDVHEVGPALGTFDVVICSGLLYHVADPTNVLLALASVCSGTMLLESEVLVEDELTDCARFVEGTYMGYSSTWWIYGPECLAGMVRAAGFAKAEFKGFYRRPIGQRTPEGIPRGGRGLVIASKRG